ncbi:deoxyribose-phosphate aldolase [Flammeovirgaceae bacterium 311]|nr:deoxyribose-phosphate aldolase [Flammeovirgaceae bacterium 311]
MNNLHRYIEHTNLKPTLTHYDIEKLVEEARAHEFVGICVPPFWVKKAKRDIGEAPIQLVTVIGFPLGYHMTETKLEEMRLAIRDGADELDMVMNVSAMKAEMSWVKIEVARCAQLAHEHERILKVIIETAYLTEKELELACRWCADAGVDYVKTSTGFAPEGARVEDVRKMREMLPSSVGVKASGGIRNLSDAVQLIQAGADRLGTSAGVALVKESRQGGQKPDETDGSAY